MAEADRRLSVYLSYLLRHDPAAASLDMDRHGWVDVGQLIQHINGAGQYSLSMVRLEHIVETDSKGRYRFSEDRTRIKACQGHSIPWVEPELTIRTPPAVLYHGTTEEAWTKIRESGFISKMSRHAVHLQAETEKAWQSARRWHQAAVVLQIDAEGMSRAGMVFGVSDNGVWCTEQVPAAFVSGVLR